VNGATWTELNGNLYSRSLDRCFVPLDIQQRAYSTCGGADLAFDDKCVSGHVLGLPDNMAVHAVAGDDAGGAGLNVRRNLACLEAAAGQTAHTGYRAIEGQTVDSSLQQRMENFHAQVVASESDFVSQTVTIEIRFPIQGGPFNSLWGASRLSRADPRLRMALGIPNYNQGQITYNFRNLMKTIVRRLGRSNGYTNTAGVAAADGATARVAGHTYIAGDLPSLTVTYDTSYAPRLELTYIRLPSFRSYPQSSALSIYRRDVRRSAKQTIGNKVFGGGLFDDGADKTGLKPIGALHDAPTISTLGPIAGSAASSVDVEFNGIQFPQVPNHLFIVFEKSSDVYNLKNSIHTGLDLVAPPAAAGDYALKWTVGAVRNVFNGHVAATAAVSGQLAANTVGSIFNEEVASRYIAQNQASNAAIMQLEITVQSAVGSWSFRSDKYPYVQDRDLLWKKHAQNCCDDYMKAGRGAWQDRASCALLSCSDFLLGLQTGPGTVFPIILDVKVKYANRASVSSGLCYTTGRTKGKMVFDDFICGTPVVVACFNQQILSIASSSAVLSAQAFSQSTFASAVSQQG